MEKVIKYALVLIALSFVIAALAYQVLPETIVSHWNERGEANGWMGKISVFVIPIICLGLFLLLVFIPRLDPLKKNYVSFRAHYDRVILVFCVFMFYLFLLTLSWNYYQFNMMRFLSIGFAFLLYYLGIMLAHSKRTWFVGIRTPWTLSSDRVWNETHKLGGNLFKISALICLLGIPFPSLAIWFLLVPLLISTVWVILYSYLEFLKGKR
jgi:uncharacterized membrane protein